MEKKEFLILISGISLLVLFLGLIIISDYRISLVGFAILDNSSCPAEISSSGYYELNGSMACPLGENGIRIDSSDVILDCKEYTIDSEQWGNNGIRVESGYSNITIQNCNIQNFNYGMRLNSNVTIINTSIGDYGVSCTIGTYAESYGDGGGNGGCLSSETPEDNSPNVTLNKPANEMINKTTTQEFNCSANDDINLANLTLYVWGGDDLQYNVSFVDLTGEVYTSYTGEYTLSDLIEDEYNWNCLAYDNASQKAWADSNYSFTIDLTAPYFTVEGIPDNESLVYGTIWNGTQFNATDNFEFDSYFINDTDNFVINQNGFLNWTMPLNVSNYYVNVSINDSAGNINYTIYNLNITKKDLNITADDNNKTYGEDDPEFNVSYSGFVYDENKSYLDGTLNVTRDSGEDVGTYNITPSGLTSNNYEITYINGTFTIEAAPSPPSNGGGGGGGTCTPESDSAFCSRYNAECGLVSGEDNCNIQRTDIDCGSCDSGYECEENQCVLVEVDECDVDDYPQCFDNQTLEKCVENSEGYYEIVLETCEEGYRCSNDVCILVEDIVEEDDTEKEQVTRTRRVYFENVSIPRPSDYIPSGNVPDVVVDVAGYGATAGVVATGIHFLWFWLISLFLPLFLLRLKHFCFAVIDVDLEMPFISETKSGKKTKKQSILINKKEIDKFIGRLEKNFKEKIIYSESSENTQRYVFAKSGFLELQLDMPLVINVHFSSSRRVRRFKKAFLRTIEELYGKEKGKKIKQMIMFTKETASVISIFRQRARERKMRKMMKGFKLA